MQINYSKSDPAQLSTGLSQGSCAGPWGYTTYTGFLGLLIRVLFLLYLMFADDTQLHTSLRPSSKISQFQSREKLEQGLEKVVGWMTENRLKLNSEKPEFILIDTRQQLTKMEYNSSSIGDDTVTAKPCIRNLGIWMDSKLKWLTMCTTYNAFLSYESP